METEKPRDWEQMQNENRKRSQTTAIVFGIITAISLASITYAFVQKGIADIIRLDADRNAESAQKMADSLKIKLNQCVEEAKRQQQLSEQAAEAAREAMQKALKK